MKLDVIIPVGPGHENAAHRAVGSLEMAQNYDHGLFTEIDMIVVDDTRGEMGRSKARNKAVQSTDADWLFFLDADDILLPSAFANFKTAMHPLTEIPYDAVWGKIVEYKEGLLLERFQIPTISLRKTILDVDPYLTLQMGHFVKARVAKDNPFHEDMNTGEDWEYYLRVWDDYSCVKVDTPFMANIRGEHSRGAKSANGVEWREVVEKLIEDAR